MDGLIKYKYGRYQFLLLYLSYHLSILIDKAGHYFCGDRPRHWSAADALHFVRPGEQVQLRRNSLKTDCELKTFFVHCQ